MGRAQENIISLAGDLHQAGLLGVLKDDQVDGEKEGVCQGVISEVYNPNGNQKMELGTQQDRKSSKPCGDTHNTTQTISLRQEPIPT